MSRTWYDDAHEDWLQYGAEDTGLEPIIFNRVYRFFIDCGLIDYDDMKAYLFSTYYGDDEDEQT